VNQTTQLHAVAQAMGAGDHDAWFTPYYGDRVVTMMRELGLIEMTIGGKKRRQWCIDWLTARGARIDVDGRGGHRAGYDLVVTCTDLVVPKNIRKSPIVVIQEGILDPERWLAWLCRHSPLPRWIAGTSLTGESGLYDRFCVASEGYKGYFVARGADPAKVIATGIPNFDDCIRFRKNDFPHRGYVLAATSDTRETLKLADSRRAFIRRVLRIAGGRKVIFKLHPNENERRERALIAQMAPEALVFQSGSAEEMIANCDVLVTQWSSVAFVGLALGKEVHSSWPTDVLRRLCPIQNGGTSAEAIAGVCRDLLSLPPPLRARAAPQEISP
jgi:hypothetical protein